MPKVRSGRRKRDTAGHIYATCKMAGTCPSDVVNKIEHTTIADKILQWGSAGVYFGGAGISTGKSAPPLRPVTRPPTGFRPLTVPRPPRGPSRMPTLDPAGVPAVAVARVVHPPAPDVPSSMLTYTLVEPGPNMYAPTLVEAPTEPGVVIAQPTRPPNTLPPRAGSLPGSGERGIEMEVFVDRSGPELVAGPHGGPVMSRPGPTVYSTSHYGNPAFEVAPSTADVIGETSVPDVVHVTENVTGGVHVSAAHALAEPVATLYDGAEPDLEFELQDLGPPIGPDEPAVMQETLFRTSTPVREPVAFAPERPPGRAPRDSIWSRLFGRRVEQIPVMEDIFLTRPQDLVQFDNPAYEQSLSMIFERDVQAVAEAAPDAAFSDVVKLSAPVTTMTTGGRLRLSRLGWRGNIRTRSGIKVGAPQSHFYRELSSIAPDEVIEMQPLGEHTGAATVIQGDAETALASYPLPGHASDPEGVADDQVLDTDLVTVDLTQPVLGAIHETTTVPVVIWRLPEEIPLFPSDIGGATEVLYPTTNTVPLYPLVDPPVPEPAVILNMYGSDYYLHPSLLRRRRKHILL